MTEIGIKIAPSILAADFGRLTEQVQEAEAAGVDWIHLDVMDGHFVPNLTFGSLVVQAVRKATALPLDVHLMIDNAPDYLEQYVQAGADWLTVHQEACVHLQRVIQQIKDLGCKAGVALNPATPLSTLEEILPELDMVLLLLVNPGFGGQSLLPSTLTKISRLRKMLDNLAPTAELQVDGGVNENTLASVVQAGASVLVMGTAVFNPIKPVAENLIRLRELLEMS